LCPEGAAKGSRIDRPGGPAQDAVMLKGPLLMLAGIGVFGLLDAISKTLSADHAVWQVLLVRFTTILALMAMLRAVRPGWGGKLRVARPGLQLLRSSAMLGSAVSFYTAFSRLPLVEGYLVFFTAPFFVLGLSALLRDEVPPRAAWLWVALGFLGVAVGLGPGFVAGLGGSLVGYLWAMLGTLCYAAVFVLNRRLRGEQGVAAVLVWPAVLGFAATLGPGLLHWVAPTPGALALMLASGVLVAGATALLALAFRYATASRLAPFGYSGLVWSLTYDLLLFGHVPGWTLFLGAAIIVFACIMSERTARA